MAAKSRILELAAQIQISNAVIDDFFLKENNLPTPSFDENGPVAFGLKSEEAKAALDIAKASSLELFDLLQGPALALRPAYDGVSLQAIYRYDIAAKVPINGEISYEDLSAKCGLEVTNLRRILRFAMVWNRCFEEPRKGCVAHSAVARYLVADPSARSGLGFMFEECWQSFSHTLDAIEEHGESVDVTKTGWSHYHKTDKSLFEYQRMHPEMSTRIAKAMQCFSASNTIKNGHGNVVDIGGAEDHVSVELAKSYPNLTFVVQDLPDVVKGAKESLPPEVQSRSSVMGHNFFDDQLLEGDVYLYSQIFHDWPDAKCIRILKALIPKMKPGARVVCYDHLLPEPGTSPFLRERAARLRDMDMIMLSHFNPRERDIDDWTSLFQATDARFGKVNAWVREGGRLGIIESVWRG